jgi:hypothetical protein
MFPLLDRIPLGNDPEIDLAPVHPHLEHVTIPVVVS